MRNRISRTLNAAVVVADVFCVLFLIQAASAAGAGDPGEARKLFDGRSLKGWVTAKGEPVAKGWIVEDGCLVRSGHGGDIFTDQDYGDFDLTLEWKIAPGVNSGVKYRVRPADGQMLGPEYQIIDEKAEGAKGGVGATGSLYAMYAPTVEDAQKPAGEWNTTRIVARGGRIEHYLNGVKLVEADTAGDDWKARKAKSKFAKVEGFGEQPGKIMLQDHGPAGVVGVVGEDKAWFRNIEIRTP